MNKKEIAKQVFDLFPKMEEVHVAFDGQSFTSDHSAMNHSKEANGNQPLTDVQMPEKFTRAEVSEKAAEKTKVVKLNVEQLVELINAAETVEAVDEIAGADNRAGVTKAAEAKKAELTGGKAE